MLTKLRILVPLLLLLGLASAQETAEPYGTETTPTAQRSGIHYEDSLILTQQYIVNEGAVISTHGHALYIVATERITIAGTMNVSGAGALGGAPGMSGEEGYGVAGTPGNSNGGGGSGPREAAIAFMFLSDPTQHSNHYGSGGGGAQTECDTNRASSGGGGGGTPTRAGGRGGDAGNAANYAEHKPGAGGSGGGSIFLRAPIIQFTRTAILDVRGMPGEAGIGNCGAGGGGSGGMVYVACDVCIDEGLVYVNGGKGGSAETFDGATEDSQYAGRSTGFGGGEGGGGAEGYYFKVKL